MDRIKTAVAADSLPQKPAFPKSQVAQMTDIHDIKPTLGLGADYSWLVWAAAILALLVLIVLGWRLWKGRKPVRPEWVAPEPIAADQEALLALDALAAEDPIEVKQFYFRLSAILRRYIERQFAIPAAEMTTEELLPRINQLPLDTELVQPLKVFCRDSDPIKFAGLDAAAGQIPRDLAFARHFVHRTASEQSSKVALAHGNHSSRHQERINTRSRP